MIIKSYEVKKNKPILPKNNFYLLYGENYGYQTSISGLMVSHLKKKIKFLYSKKYIKKNSFILDIGSNDGTFLNFFKRNPYFFNLN